jgi:hypothetical protein
MFRTLEYDKLCQFLASLIRCDMLAAVAQIPRLLLQNRRFILGSKRALLNAISCGELT